jgi:uracil-DNA glycosylase
MTEEANNPENISSQIHPSWKEALQEEFTKEYFIRLQQFLQEEKLSGNIIYPPKPLIYNAFNITPIEKVKVVILGQDPYHGPGQAHGLSFSVHRGIAFPPSLRNIFKELKSDLNIDPPLFGDLERWAEQGVFLLNAILTVKANSPASHQKIGWENFTDAVIEAISKQREGVVFILWGAFAQGKEIIIDQNKHFIIKSPHPSPFSAAKGFFGSKPFSRTNQYLKSVGKDGIDWRL